MKKRLRHKGHKLTITWSGEYGIESSSTGECMCGWQESASNQREVHFEYRHHLITEKARLITQLTGEDLQVVRDRLRVEYRGV